LVKNCNNTYKYSHFNLSYQQFGSGERVMLCFHGYGESAEKYSFLGSSIGTDYTIYAFDFFHHGNSDTYNKDPSITMNGELWAKLISNFLDERSISTVDLLGYSMGGRLSLALIQYIPERLQKITLLAPDGIYDSFWFQFATRNFLGKRLFRNFTKNPNPYLSILNVLTRIKIFPTKLSQIAKINTSSEINRKKVLATWMILSQIKISIKRVEKSIAEHDLHLTISVGQYDKVISARKISNWKWVKYNNKNFIVANQGHLFTEAEVLSSLEKVNH
jgi:pimeloyl-ACP methyl ester carboxylesterase